MDRYLEEGTETKTLRPFIPRPSTCTLPLPPRFAQLLDLVGRRADDPLVQTYVNATLRQKVPMRTGVVEPFAHASAKRLGVEVEFTHDTGQKKLYPEAEKSRYVYLPYLTRIFLSSPGWTEELPFGLRWDDTPETLTEILGEVRNTRHDPHWKKLLDEGRKVGIRVEHGRKGVRLAIGIL